jgi:hypothetical protein
MDQNVVGRLDAAGSFPTCQPLLRKLKNVFRRHVSCSVARAIAEINPV